MHPAPYRHINVLLRVGPELIDSVHVEQEFSRLGRDLQLLLPQATTDAEPAPLIS